MRINVYTIIFLSVALAGCSKQKKETKPLAHNLFEQSHIEAEDQRYKHALQLVNKSIKVDPTPQALAHKATLLYRLNDFEGSLALFEKIINHNDATETLKADSKNNYACLLNQMGKTKEAEKIWLELSCDKNYLTPEVAFFNLGLLSLTKNDIVNAINNLKRATLLSPDYIDAFYYLAVAYMHIGNYKDAHQAATTIISFVPEHQAAQEIINYINRYRLSKPTRTQ